jgi:hypothetical protein
LRLWQQSLFAPGPRRLDLQGGSRRGGPRGHAFFKILLCGCSPVPFLLSTKSRAQSRSRFPNPRRAQITNTHSIAANSTRERFLQKENLASPHPRQERSGSRLGKLSPGTWRPTRTPRHTGGDQRHHSDSQARDVEVKVEVEDPKQATTEPDDVGTRCGSTAYAEIDELLEMQG